MREFLQPRNYRRYEDRGKSVAEGKRAEDAAMLLEVNAANMGAKSYRVGHEIFIAPGEPIECLDISNLRSFEERIRSGFEYDVLHDKSFTLIEEHRSLFWTKVPTKLSIARSNSLGGTSVSMYVYPENAIASVMADYANAYIDMKGGIIDFEEMKYIISSGDIQRAQSGELHEMIKTNLFLNQPQGNNPKV